ncbi:MAG TPA: LPS export ABC transporter periplasmic protein LptC [candidate division Zixibacteria bacterium]|nr:LPS export ABC transporter periplasmic protein LptC [candidate division Zixibacteria bacterium]
MKCRPAALARGLRLQPARQRSVKFTLSVNIGANSYKHLKLANGTTLAYIGYVRTRNGETLLKLTDRYFFLILFAIGVLFSACSQSSEEIHHQTNSRNANRVMHNASIEFTEAGKPSGHLKADSLLFFDLENRTLGFEIEVIFYDTDGNYSGTMVADSGWIENQSQRITVYGEVFIHTVDDVRLWTDSLAYYPGTSRIRTEAGVRIEKGGEFITGQAFDSDLAFEDIRITDNVSGRLKQD